MPASAKESAFKDLRKIREVSLHAAPDSSGAHPRLGRPPKPGAKSRNPDYRAWTGYLRRDTVTDADYQLKRGRDGRTMSELMQELLATWVAQQGSR